MTTYISWEIAFQMLSTAYMLPLVMLMAVSYIALVLVETVETSEETLLPKWFTESRW